MATASYFRMMEALEGAEIDHIQPSSGTVRFIDQVKVTVLAPGSPSRTATTATASTPTTARSR